LLTAEFLSLFVHVGAGAVEFIICHAEVSIAFAEEKKIPEVSSSALNSWSYNSSILICTAFQMMKINH